MKPRSILPVAISVLVLTLTFFLYRQGNATMPETIPSFTPEAEQDAAKKGEEVKLETATFANGCFWCTEAVFQQIKGVKTVVSGYMGGTVKNPTYEQICTGNTGHAECIQVTFDPKVIKFAELLEVFWLSHDPTTKNRQGADVGTQYRSAVFYHTKEQKEQATAYMKKLDEAKAFSNPIVTEITEASTFYPAENYHQNYFNLNGKNPYCQFTVAPKVEKIRKVFKEKLKTAEESKK